jgi:tetratricopeptide (TPR) repeat protein
MGQAQQFMPMALAAYERARPLDHDGLYHLSVLNRVAMNLEESIANAAEVLAQNPDHLLALAAAAQAAIELGRPDEAEAYYRHLVEVYGVEMASQKPEYLDHSGITNDLRNVAEGFLVGR